jgi:hypothetical protein
MPYNPSESETNHTRAHTHAQACADTEQVSVYVIRKVLGLHIRWITD